MVRASLLLTQVDHLTVGIARNYTGSLIDADDFEALVSGDAFHGPVKLQNLTGLVVVNSPLLGFGPVQNSHVPIKSASTYNESFFAANPTTQRGILVR